MEAGAARQQEVTEEEEVKKINWTVNEKESRDGKGNLVRIKLTAEMAAYEKTCTIECGQDAKTQVMLVQMKNSEKKLKRRGMSTPFPTGSFTVEWAQMDKDKHYYTISLKKTPKEIKLSDYLG